MNNTERSTYRPVFEMKASAFREENGEINAFTFKKEITKFATENGVPIQDAFTDFIDRNLKIEPTGAAELDQHLLRKGYLDNKGESDKVSLGEVARLSWRMDSQGGVLGEIYLIKALGLNVGEIKGTKLLLEHFSQDLGLQGLRSEIRNDIEGLIGVPFGSLLPKD